MADFCRQCSIDTFGEDTKDLAGLTTKEDWAADKAAIVLCEGCGPTQVDPEGACISTDCLEGHGAEFVAEGAILTKPGEDLIETVARARETPGEKT